MSVKQDRLAMPSVPEEIEPKGLSSGTLGGLFGALNAAGDDLVGEVDRKAEEQVVKDRTGSQVGRSGMAELALRRLEQDTEKGKKKEQDALFEATLRVQEYLDKLDDLIIYWENLANEQRELAIRLRLESEGLFNVADILEDAQQALMNGTATPEQRATALAEVRKKDPNVADDINAIDLAILTGIEVRAIRKEAAAKNAQADSSDNQAKNSQDKADITKKIRDDLARDAESTQNLDIIKQRVEEAGVNNAKAVRENEGLSDEASLVLEQAVKEDNIAELPQTFDF